MTSFRSRTLRIVAATALTVGLAGTTSAAFALTPAQVPGPGDIVSGGDGPDDPRPTGPDDITAPTPGPECHPFLASCDITNPTDPGDPGDPGDPDQPGADNDVDAPVVARPTFTG